MTPTERKALALVNECAGQEVYGGWGTFDPNQSPCTRALCRAIEQHDAFRQEVSDAVESLCNTVLMSHGHRQLREMLSRRFILPKPDPVLEEDPIDALVDLFAPVLTKSQGMAARERENRFRNALAALVGRDPKIVEATDD